MTATLPEIPWAKSLRDRDTGALRLLPLADHCADVAAVMEGLLAIPLVRRRLVTLAGAEWSEALPRAMVAAAFLHDIGKANAGFQRKILPIEAWGQGPIAGHVAEAVPLLLGRKIDPGHPIVGRWRRNEAARALLGAALAHHGAPLGHDKFETSSWVYSPELWQPWGGYDPVAGVRHALSRMEAWMPREMESLAELRACPVEVTHMFLGLLSLADWIASRSTPEFFPFDGHGDGDRWAFARDRARHALTAMSIEREAAGRSLRLRAPSFGEVFRAADGAPLSPSPVQRAMERDDLGPIVVLEASTGSGKTEAALWRFRHLMAKGEVDGLVFLLPTRTSAVQIERRVREAAAALWPNPSERPNVVLAVPGYLRADGVDGWLEPGFGVVWPDGGEREILAYRRWAAETPKRALAAAIVVGTIDQALLSVLRVRHAHLRGAGLPRQLLVVDEVHASDAYMTELLRELLARQCAAGGHALLLSATLGAVARGTLLHPDARQRPEPPPLPAASSLPYPLMSDARTAIAVSADSRSRRVAIRIMPALDAPDEVARIAVDAARQGARVLVVRNEVRLAIATQLAVEELAGEGEILFRADGVVAPHHGRFAAPDRKMLDRAVERVFGKGAPRGGGVVLVGTQTLEQSLDIDADLLLADLCPMDVLLQRIGRLHRHAMNDPVRPAAFRTPVAIVVVPGRRGLEGFLERGGHGFGRGRAYENLLAIEATWRELEARAELDLPGDCRALVEAATHPEAMRALAVELGGPWRKAHLELLGADGARAQHAGNAVFRWSEPLSGSDGLSFAQAVEERLATRLGVGDRRFRLAPPCVSPFGNLLEEIVIPGWMLPGGCPEDIDTVSATPGYEEFAIDIAGRTFRYSRYGLMSGP